MTSATVISQRIRERVTSPEMQDAFKRWFDASPAFSGPVWANRAGWQVARAITKNAAIAVRGLRPTTDVPAELAETLHRDGIVIIPDYLSTERYEAVRAAYQDYATSPHVRDIGAENNSHIGFRLGHVISDGPNDSAAVINGTFARDPLIVGLGEQIIHRRIRTPLTVIFQSLDLIDGEDATDREQLLHTDKFFPCAKAIFFVDRVDANSSPFVYCPGSHRLSMERLRWERAIGTREAMLRARRVDEFDRFDEIGFERSRNVIGPEFRARLGLEERPVTCEGNTLVVVNNQGFHRRGVLAPGASRHSLWMNFYAFQRPIYGRIAFRAAKRAIDTNDVPRRNPAIHHQTINGDH